MNNQTIEPQRMEMSESESIEYSRGQITGVFLSQQHLEKLIENYIPNPLARTIIRTFRKGTSNLLTTRYAVNFKFIYEFNDIYVPTTREYEMARKQLELLKE
jgi:hypothetical protein